MSYTHFTIAERSKIETLLELGFSIRRIAHKLGRAPSSISRELKRNPNYTCEKAQERYVQKKAKCGAKVKLTPKNKEIIQEKLNDTWSPEQIIGRLFRGTLSFKTIYRWIYLDLLNVPLSVLRQKGKQQNPKETRGRFNVGTPISKRPSEVKKRTTFGHWELDTVVSGRGQAKGCVATFLERKSRQYIAIKMVNRSASSMEQAIKTLYTRLPKTAFRTFTTDRGKEFSCYPIIEKELGIPVYFADPYSSWQRGSNENSNGLLREFFPKKTNFDHVTEENLNKALQLINDRPRKCLNYRTSNEAFMDEVLHLI